MNEAILNFVWEQVVISQNVGIRNKVSQNMPYFLYKIIYLQRKNHQALCDAAFINLDSEYFNLLIKSERAVNKQTLLQNSS